jgi:hypothetical protein
VVKLVAEDAERRSAFLNVTSAINVNARLPDQVFVGNWHRFYFTESDEVASSQFVNAVHALLSSEPADCCCLLNLSRPNALNIDAATTIFLDKTTTPENYWQQLRLGGPFEAWLNDMGRYCCASDRGAWSIYCERNNDIAIFALRSPVDSGRFAPALRKLRGARIENLVNQPSRIPIPFGALTDPWRSGLVDNFGKKRRTF